MVFISVSEIQNSEIQNPSALCSLLSAQFFSSKRYKKIESEQICYVGSQYQSYDLLFVPHWTTDYPAYEYLLLHTVLQSLVPSVSVGLVTPRDSS